MSQWDSLASLFPATDSEDLLCHSMGVILPRKKIIKETRSSEPLLPACQPPLHHTGRKESASSPATLCHSQGRTILTVQDTAWGFAHLSHQDRSSISVLWQILRGPNLTSTHLVTSRNCPQSTRIRRETHLSE
jgi:hypothetical protein